MAEAPCSLLRVRDIGQLVQVCSNGERLLKGAAMRDVAITSRRAGKSGGASGGVCLVVNAAAGVIADIG